MENNVAINPEFFHKVSSILGWNTISGCKITHFSLDQGVIKSVGEYIHIHFLDDPEEEERRFFKTIFLDDRVQDLEMSPKILNLIEKTLGYSIENLDVEIARKRREIFKLLKRFEFDLAEQLFQEIKTSLSFKEIEKYYGFKKDQEKEFVANNNKKLIETTQLEINYLLKAHKFIEARNCFKKIAHLMSEEEFNQDVLRFQIPYELDKFNFIECDRLIIECTVISYNEYQTLKAKAIQKYFYKPDNRVTQEQAIAIANNHQNLLIKARAGSGKTRILACKTALLIDHYYVNPDQILILSFNKKAAEEIAHRIKKVFGFESFENARTFHSLAYQVVGLNGNLLFDKQGEFSRPAFTSFVQEILRTLWFPLKIQPKIYQLFRKELRSLTRAGGLLSDADFIAYIRNRRDITLGGDRVKSNGEKYIADFLFEHDIQYYYERVEFWSGHNYRPDFTLFHETRQIVIEFWGIDENDPKKSTPDQWNISWEDYKNQIIEKRNYWKDRGIPLLELSVSDVRNGRSQFEELLKDKLSVFGIEKEKLNQKELEKKVVRFQKDRMTELFVQFIQRAKKSMLSVEEVQRKIKSYQSEDEREKLFLDLGILIYSEYEKKLKETNSIDFDDLIMNAGKLIRESQGHCSIDLGLRKNRRLNIKNIKWILIDEFQDFSNEFHFLLSAMREVNSEIQIVCVGDNWQSINSFAGSEQRFFEQFPTFFPESKTLNLLTNHRSQKAIVDFGNLVMARNGEPGVSSPDNGGGNVELQFIDEIRIELRDEISFAVDKARDQRFVFYEERESGKKVNDNGFLQAKYLKACYEIIKEPSNWSYLTGSKSKKPIIAILSRMNSLYRVTLEEFFDQLMSCFTSEEIKEIGNFHQKIKISTVHKFKGLEAEVVIMLKVCDGSFPLLHPDDSLFKIFGQTDKHLLDEEKRLFYVGVTRPSRKLYLLTEKENESTFLRGKIL